MNASERQADQLAADGKRRAAALAARVGPPRPVRYSKATRALAARLEPAEDDDRDRSAGR